MGDMRKDYVSEHFMIVSKKDDKAVVSKKSPFAPGNESMTNPSVLSLVEKDGMLQRLKIVKMIMLKVGQFVFLKVRILLFQLTLKILIVINHFTVNLHTDIIMSLLHLQTLKILFQQFFLNSGLMF